MSDLEEVRVCRQVTRDVCAQISGVVGEQEVGLRQMLRTMGMLDSAYWLSWMLFEVPCNHHLHDFLATLAFFTWAKSYFYVSGVATRMCCSYMRSIAQQHLRYCSNTSSVCWEKHLICG